MIFFLPGVVGCGVVVVTLVVVFSSVAMAGVVTVFAVVCTVSVVVGFVVTAVVVTVVVAASIEKKKSHMTLKMTKTGCKHHSENKC